MIQLPSRSFVLGTLVFLASVWALLFVRLLPLSAGIMGWPGPDLALALILAWVLRRPDQLAAPVIVGLFGVVIERLLLRWIYKLDHLYGLLLTLGLTLLIEGVFRSVYGVSGLSYDAPDALSSATDLGFNFRYPELDEALAAALR